MTETEKKGERKGGASRQLIGITLLALGFLNAMLSLKTGHPIGLFNWGLLISGSVTLASGILGSKYIR